MTENMSDVTTETPTIEKLASAIIDGEVVLPKFQRPFVWRKSEILSLLESIEANYPIGSILLWESPQQELSSERQIGDLDINSPRSGYPLRYVLDGQQRLSSLCGPLFWEGGKPTSNWNIAYDLREQTFFHLRITDDLPPHQIRLNQLLGDAFFEYFLELDRLESSDKDLLKERARNLNRRFSKYEIPVIVLKNVHSSKIAEIFEQINKTGRRLTTVDLMQAATWRSDFDLMASIDSIRAVSTAEGFSTIEPINILRNISAAAGKRFHAASIMSLRDLSSEELENAVFATRKAYQKAVDFFVKTIGVDSADALPYANQITIITEVFRSLKKINVHQTIALQNWFWQTSLTDYFQGWNTARMEVDLLKIHDFASSKTLTLSPDSRRSSQPNFLMWQEEKYSSRSALSKAFVILLEQQKPVDLLNGLRIGATKSEAPEYEMELHHVFPKKFLKNHGVDENKINCLANRIMLQARSNKEISSKAPSIYFREVEKISGDQLNHILASNIIPTEAFEAALHDNYDDFLHLRAKAIHDVASQKAGWKSSL